MIIETLKRIGWFVALILVQVLILNHLHIMGYATPFLYVYLLLKMPSSVSRSALLLWGFSIGLAVDLFSNTPGMNAAATTFLALMLPRITQLYLPKGDTEVFVPGIYTVGFAFFVKYAFTAILLHHSALFLIESFSFWDVHILLLKIVWSTLLTFFCVMALDGLNK